MNKPTLYQQFRSRIATDAKSPAGRMYRAARKFWRSAHAQRIPLDRLLCGGEQAMNGRQFALHTGDLARTSRPISESPHSRFIRQYQEMGEDIFNPDVLQATDYYHNAVRCMRSLGAYFNMTDESQIANHLRAFVARFEGRPITEGAGDGTCYSETDQPVLVFPIKYSDYYQVFDGNHRVAIALGRGQKTISVRVVPQPQLTCLQQLLLDVSWNLNKRDLYQPLQSPELGEQWELVRRCTDRLEMMRKFLKDEKLLPPQTKSYLDIACNYGWFVKSMGEAGYESQGLELDWAARQIGIHFYDLTESQIIRGEVVRFFQANPPQRDIVSCFSLVHHFARRQGTVSAEQMIRWLDGITGKVLFFEMGDEGEAWFHQSLAGWNPTTIAQWLAKNTSFTRIIPLGTDKDRTGRYEHNYNRTLFACVR